MNDLHAQVLVLLDTSSSMGLQVIHDLQVGINSIKNRIIKSRRIADVIDICVMGFN